MSELTGVEGSIMIGGWLRASAQRLSSLLTWSLVTVGCDAREVAQEPVLHPSVTGKAKTG